MNLREEDVVKNRNIERLDTPALAIKVSKYVFAYGRATVIQTPL